METRLLLDLDQDLPEVNLLTLLPRRLDSASILPVLQAGSRYPWSKELRLRASWVYPEQAVFAYAQALRERAAPVEIALDRYGLIRGSEQIETFYGRFRESISMGTVSESGTASYALFLGDLVEDLVALFGSIDRIYLMLPGLFPAGVEANFLTVLRRRLPSGVGELVGVYERGAAECDGCLFKQREVSGKSVRYRGVLKGVETELHRGETPFWANPAIRELLEGAGGAAYAWRRLSAAIEVIWESVRRGGELQTELLMAAAAGDPSPLGEIVVLERKLLADLNALRIAADELRVLLPRFTAHPELLLVPARAAERAASTLKAELSPLGNAVDGVPLPSPKNEAPLDR